jgi:hypothetical protein
VLPPALAVVYVQHSPDRYPGVLDTLKGYLARLWYCQPYLLVVDNRHEDLPFTPTGVRSAIVGGDNTDREFSGWQRGIEALGLHVPSYEMALLSNEAFLAPGPSYLSKYPTLDDVLRWHRYAQVAGRIDALPTPVSVFGKSIDSWVCTNSMLVPREALDRLGRVVSVTEHDLERFLPPVCPEAISTTHVVPFTREDAERGGVQCELALPAHRNLLVTIDAGASFVPRRLSLNQDDRELGIYVRGLEVGQRSLADAVSTVGWYPDGECGWTAPRFSASFAGVTRGTARLSFSVPPSLLTGATDRFDARVTFVGDPFLPDAPLSANYRLLMLEWLTMRWRQRFAVGPRTWHVFRDKLRAILNEAYLSRRLRDLGHEIVTAGPERFY